MLDVTPLLSGGVLYCTGHWRIQGGGPDGPWPPPLLPGKKKKKKKGRERGKIPFGVCEDLITMGGGGGGHVTNREGAQKSSGKSAGLLPVTGKYRFLVLDGCTHMSETSGISTGHQAVCAPTQNHQPIHLAFTCTYL